METGLVRELAQAEGPVASVYLDVTRSTENARQEIELRWREAREELEDQLADRPTIDALEEALRTAQPAVGAAGRVLVAADGEVLLDEEVSEPPALPYARWSPLPQVLPVLADSAPGAPLVVAVVDRIGADLRLYERNATLRAEHTVEGETHPVHKVRGLGWSHHRAQQRVEDTAARNAGEIAEEIDRLVRRSGAGLVLVAGEVRARNEVLAALPPNSQQRAVSTEVGGRAEGTDTEALEDEIRALLREKVAQDTRDALEEFRAELGRGSGRALSGLRPVLTALREGRMDTVLLRSTGLEQRVYVGPEHSQVAVDREELGLPEEEVTTERADAAVVAAAALTGAHVHLFDEDETVPTEVGGLLRYAAR
ncbi:Vms1/Ankzf1 family peptidyl-tRNA hydrolase [Actinoalloteichus caeruleus]|uniref:Rv2629 family ribosome hibernation factor n=1 Tax=Actinoalloteichus cyanogriseus TaxID=2893586 RepID=UPI0004AA949C|nr:Vms1/Ankzf1 family peptidyl-tRNA hydrolase [Actinoalloteichus caeruleus]